jgi:hypothetical protein
MNREKNDFDGKSPLLDLSQYAEPIERRHVRIEDGDAWRQGPNLSKCRGTITGFGDHLQQRITLNHLHEATSHYGVIVGNYDADFIVHWEYP